LTSNFRFINPSFFKKLEIKIFGCGYAFTKDEIHYFYAHCPEHGYFYDNPHGKGRALVCPKGDYYIRVLDWMFW